MEEARRLVYDLISAANRLEALIDRRYQHLSMETDDIMVGTNRTPTEVIQDNEEDIAYAVRDAQLCVTALEIGVDLINDLRRAENLNDVREIFAEFSHLTGREPESIAHAVGISDINHWGGQYGINPNYVPKIRDGDGDGVVGEDLVSDD